MEPFGISISFTAVLTICQKIAKGLYTVHQNAALLDEVTKSLEREVSMLSSIAESLDNILKDHHSCNSENESRRCNHSGLQFVDSARSECQRTLESIAAALFDMNSGSLASSFINQIRAGSHLQRVVTFTQQVAAQRQSLTLTIQLVYLLALNLVANIASEYNLIQREPSKPTNSASSSFKACKEPIGCIESTTPRRSDITWRRWNVAARNGMQYAELKLGLKEYAAAEEILSKMLTTVCDTNIYMRHKIQEMLGLVYWSQGQWEAAAGVLSL